MRLASALLALAPLALGQQTITPANAAHGAIRADEHGFVLPAGEFSAGELVEAAAAFLCRNYLYDYGEVERAGSFALQRPLAVDALGCEELLYALLASRGFAVLPIDELRGVWGIILLEGEGGRSQWTPSLASPWRSPDDILRRPALREIAFSHLVLDNADAREVARMLQQTGNAVAWRPGHLLATATDRHMLALHGYRDQIANAILLARELDRLAAARPAPPAPLAVLLRRIAELERRVAELERGNRDGRPR